MGLFDYENFKVVINPDAVIIPPFIDVWERDKSKNKLTATKELSYIYFLCDFKSPYSIYSEADRPSKVKEDFLKTPEIAMFMCNDHVKDKKLWLSILRKFKTHEQFQKWLKLLSTKSALQQNQEVYDIFLKPYD